MKRFIFIIFQASIAVSCQNNSHSDEHKAVTNSENTSEPPLAPISKIEAERGFQACEAYIDRICQCSEKHEQYLEPCKLAKTLPSALTLQLQASRAEGNLSRKDRASVISSLRKTVKKCIEKEVRLSDDHCPRPTQEK